MSVCAILLEVFFGGDWGGGGQGSTPVGEQTAPVPTYPALQTHRLPDCIVIHVALLEHAAQGSGGEGRGKAGALALILTSESPPPPPTEREGKSGNHCIELGKGVEAPKAKMNSIWGYTQPGCAD